jgi:hypothetical protein
MNETELSKESTEVQPLPESDRGRQLLVEWIDSEWFSVWLKLARHEPIEAAA